MMLIRTDSRTRSCLIARPLQPAFALLVTAIVSVAATADAGDFGRSGSNAYRSGLYGQSTNATPRYNVRQANYPYADSGMYGASATRPQVIQPVAGFGFRGNARSRMASRRGYGEDALPETIELVDRAIARSRKRYLTIGTHTPWQIFHGTLALREKFLVRIGDDLVPAIDWISSGVTHDNLPLVERFDGGGRMHAFTVPYAFEGHANQFLAILSLSGLPRDHKFHTPQGDAVTMDEMVRGAQLGLNGDGELTWTLWFLSHYVEPDAEWLTLSGEPWSMERLVQIEARKTIEDAPCGGTHRLFALALARNAYLAKHGRLAAAWREADQRVAQYVAATRQMQNSDGTFSEKWYKARGLSRELDRRLKTTGHQLEWLMAAVPQSELSSHWIQAAVRATANDVIRSAETSAECGALYHALDALALYRTRMATRFPTEKPKAEPTEQPLQQAMEDPAGTTAAADPAPAAGWQSTDSVQPPAATPERKQTATSEPTTGDRVATAPSLDEVAPQQTSLPAEVDDEAAPKTEPVRVAEAPGPVPTIRPRSAIDQSAIRSASLPSTAQAELDEEADTEPAADATTEADAVVESDDAETDANDANDADREPLADEAVDGVVEEAASPSTDKPAGMTELAEESTVEPVVAKEDAATADTQTDDVPDAAEAMPAETPEASPEGDAAPAADVAPAEVVEPEETLEASIRLRRTEPPRLQVPGIPPEARRAEILEASFRFSNLTPAGELAL